MKKQTLIHATIIRGAGHTVYYAKGWVDKYRIRKNGIIDITMDNGRKYRTSIGNVILEHIEVEEESC